MKILFCSPVQRSKELGGSKVVVELAEEMQLLGWEYQILCPSDISDPDDPNPLNSFHVNLREYLKKHATNYDVVDYDHVYLPYPRQEFSRDTLFVARSVLLAHHLATTPIPQPPGIKAAMGRWIKGKERQRRRQQVLWRAHVTVQEADLINVSNNDDKNELTRLGIAAEKVVVIPYGISRSLRPFFDQVSSVLPDDPVVAFVGTFDYRKGAREFPRILGAIADRVPDVRFRLLGTNGLFQTEHGVLSRFPKDLAHKIQVVPKYRPDELPNLLTPCSVGIFPSYMEGMPFGVLEMLAASVPVIAYDAPGSSMMLPEQYLVPRGDADTLSSRVVALLCDPAQLQKARFWAQEHSQKFSWEHAARETHRVYVNNLS